MHLRVLPPFGDIAHFVHFYGHVTRFYVTAAIVAKRNVPSESAIQIFCKWSIVYFPVIRTVFELLTFWFMLGLSYLGGKFAPVWGL